MLRLCLLLLSILAAAPAAARESHIDQGIEVVQIAALPGEVRETLSLIKRGGPFPYRKDGTTFGNFERRLPAQPRGYYREYTVPTPGAHNRGAKRIVAGKGATGDVRTSGEYYYTDNHYRSFRKIRE
jgi:ribonuclease T1